MLLPRQGHMQSRDGDPFKQHLVEADGGAGREDVVQRVVQVCGLAVDLARGANTVRDVLQVDAALL